jgi:hypothetical protein
MTSIQLKRSGGQLGKTLQASMNIDEFSYKIIINEKKTYPIDITQLKGKLKKIVSKMEDDLKV